MSIEREFVPYEQALALKELGFDEPCFAFYNGKFLDYKIQGGDICSPYLSTENRGECPNTPTFSQVFRWFREKYKISGEISSDFYLEGKDNEWEYNIYQLGKEDDGYIGTINIFKTYEEAELECLKKLIEIVKEKK